MNWYFICYMIVAVDVALLAFATEKFGGGLVWGAMVAICVGLFWLPLSVLYILGASGRWFSRRLK